MVDGNRSKPPSTNERLMRHRLAGLLVNTEVNLERKRRVPRTWFLEYKEAYRCQLWIEEKVNPRDYSICAEEFAKSMDV